MNVWTEISRFAAVARAMAYMRACQLANGASLARLAVAFFVTFGLLLLVVKPGDEIRFWELAVGVLTLKLLPVFGLVKGGEALRGELKDGTMEFLWTRPVRRSHLFLGLYIDALVGIAAMALACVAGALAAGWYRDAAGGLGDQALLAIGAMAASLAFAAVSMAFAAFTGKFALLGLLYFALVELVLSTLPTGAREAALTFHLGRLLGSLSRSGVYLDGGPAWSALVGVAAITAVFLVLGVALFSLSAYSVGADKEG